MLRAHSNPAPWVLPNGTIVHLPKIHSFWLSTPGSATAVWKLSALPLPTHGTDPSGCWSMTPFCTRRAPKKMGRAANRKRASHTTLKIRTSITTANEAGTCSCITSSHCRHASAAVPTPTTVRHGQWQRTPAASMADIGPCQHCQVTRAKSISLMDPTTPCTAAETALNSCSRAGSPEGSQSGSQTVVNQTS
eukprot:SAG11_NODE_12091_length_722_cov_1.073836_1_plen_191_part_10